MNEKKLVDYAVARGQKALRKVARVFIIGTAIMVGAFVLYAKLNGYSLIQ